MSSAVHGQDCSIGLDSLDSQRGRQRLQCGHEFHEACVTQLRRFGSKSLCPLCRVVSADLTPFENLYEDALSAYSQKTYSNAVKLLTVVLDLDCSYPPALNLMGLLYVQGSGVPRDVDKAVRMFKEAYAAGEHYAALQLGLAYCVQQDFGLASQYVTEAYHGGFCDHSQYQKVSGLIAQKKAEAQAHLDNNGVRLQSWPMPLADYHKRFCGQGSVPCGAGAGSLQVSPVKNSDDDSDDETQVAIAASIAEIPAEHVGVVVMTIARMPEALQRALATPTDYPSLTSCLRSMVVAGQLTAEAAPSMPTRCGAKIFLDPGKVKIQAVLQAIDVQGIELRNWHIVTTLDLEEHVLAIIDALTRQEFGGNQSKTKRVKQRVYIPVKTIMEHKNTFLSVSVGASMHSGSSSGPRTVSVPEPGTINPRAKVSRTTLAL